MRGAGDRDRDGVVTLAESFAYAAERTLAATVQTLPGPQHPTYRFDLGGRGELALTRLSESRRGGEIVFDSPGHYIVQKRDGAGPVVAELAASRPGGRLILTPGRYHVVRREDRAVYTGQIEVQAGRKHVVHGETLRRMPYARVVRKGLSLRRSAGLVFAQGGVRTSIEGLGTAPRVEVGGRLDFAHASVGVRVAAATSATTTRRLTIRTGEIALGVEGTHAFDFGPVSLALGVEVWGMRFTQEFGEAQTPDRETYGASVGPLLRVDLPLPGGVVLGAEGALSTYLLPVGNRPEEAALRAVIAGRILLGVGLEL